MKTWRRLRGDQAETAVQRHLERNGLRLVASNVQSRFGELDLVMEHGDVLAVIEVRKRSSQAFGGAAASVTAAKQRKLITATRHLLSSRPELMQWPLRFDVVTVDGDGTIDWIQHAFEAHD